MWKRLLSVAVILGILILTMTFRPATSSTPLGPDVVMATLDPSLIPYEKMWQKEVSRRFHHSVVILVHGGDFVQGQWIAGVSFVPGHVTPMKDVVHAIQFLYPNRTVVLLACNTGHLSLGIPGVYYSHSECYCIPDRALTSAMMVSGEDRLTFDSGFPLSDTESRWSADGDVVGNVWELTCE